MGLQTYSKLDGILLTWRIDKPQLQAYTEIDITDTELQLAMFRRKYIINNLSDAAAT